MSPRSLLWPFIIVSAALGAYATLPAVLAPKGRSPLRLLPGPTSRGHALFQEACGACHEPFGGVPNQACERCHGEALARSEDSHSSAKFADPRNAERTAALDARLCVTCHREHIAGSRDDAPSASLFTLPADFCRACHLDIASVRPSHAAFSQESCSTSGCHRFHDNRSLYEDFIAKHLHEPEVLSVPRLPASRHHASAVEDGRAAEADVPLDTPRRAALARDWTSSAHASGGVGCRTCHDRPEQSAGVSTWREQPGVEACIRCHPSEDAGFRGSKHGIRGELGLPALRAADSGLQMKGGAQAELTCMACHDAHASDTRTAALEACLGCHDDRHSRGYRAGRHAKLWAAETAGSGAPGTGVSCATCHLPRTTHREGGRNIVQINHDVGTALRPNESMARDVCARCHGLGFSLSALADAELVSRNFNGRPANVIESILMVERRVAAREGRSP